MSGERVQYTDHQWETFRNHGLQYLWKPNQNAQYFGKGGN